MTQRPKVQVLDSSSMPKCACVKARSFGEGSHIWHQPLKQQWESKCRECLNPEGQENLGTIKKLSPLPQDGAT